MKKFYALLMILAVLLVGCKSNTSTFTDRGTSSHSISPTINLQQTTEDTMEVIEEATTKVTDEVTDDATEEDSTVEMKFENHSNRVPPVADYSAMAKNLSSLNNARIWGDSLDLRLCDLSSLDLTDEYDKLSNVHFDTATKWPDKLPQGFDPALIMETGKNPGLGIKKLQAKGITGKGVNIAIVDYSLLLEHKEYCNQIKYYDEVNSNVMMDIHGPFVASICVGKTTGVAPDAGLYFIATNNVFTVNDKREIDFTYFAEAVNKIVKVNESLPKDKKIRVLSISAGWCPKNKGFEALTEAVKKAKEAGIFVISCNLFETYGFWTYSLEKDSYSNPDDPKSHKPYEWDSWIKMVSNIDGFASYYEEALNKNFNSNMLLVPIGSRTVAFPTGKNDYCFSSDGGWSTMEPYLAGLYAMACQVKVDVTPDLFWKTALETGELLEVVKGDQKYPARMLNPEKLIEKLQSTSQPAK